MQCEQIPDQKTTAAPFLPRRTDSRLTVLSVIVVKTKLFTGPPIACLASTVTAAYPPVQSKATRLTKQRTYLKRTRGWQLVGSLSAKKKLNKKAGTINHSNIRST